MKLAIVGTGISGLVCGYHLHPEHELTVYEAGNRVGGHTNTVDVERDGRHYAVDTGFIVFNDRTYPGLIELLSDLGVESQPTQMSFSVSCEATGLEYRGADWDGLFAQRRNLFNVRFHRLLWDFLRFNRLAREQIHEDPAAARSLGDFLSYHRFSDAFIEGYLLPMGSAIWSCPRDRFLEFPVQFIAEFYENHGLLSVANRPQWRVIRGGSREYIEPLTRGFADRIRLGTPVEQVVRTADGVVVHDRAGNAELFDHVIMACHADQALAILGPQASPTEREILSAFPYEPNVAVLHTQSSLLPRCRRAWACWNYWMPAHDRLKATVTYNMNLLQSLESDTVFCVTLNDSGRIRDEEVIAEFLYQHPTFDLRRRPMQARHSELIGHRGLSFCGAYWGNGFHEDGVQSGLRVVDGLRKHCREDARPVRVGVASE